MPASILFLDYTIQSCFQSHRSEKKIKPLFDPYTRVEEWRKKMIKFNYKNFYLARMMKLQKKYRMNLIRKN